MKKAYAAAGLTVALAIGGIALPLTSSTDAHAATAKTYKNCTALNKVYKHGVGRKGAKDHVKGNAKRVTNFTVNTKVYNLNKKSDRDHDGIACEKH